MEAFEGTAMPIPMVANVADMVRFLIIIVISFALHKRMARREIAVGGDASRQRRSAQATGGRV
jgi:hypothetical protein